MTTVKVKILRLNPLANLPAYATEGSVGLDLQAMESRYMWHGDATVKIPCGIALALPVGYEAQIRPRSSLTAKGIICGFGTIDSDYRGELAVVLTLSKLLDRHTIAAGDRIAQLVVMPVPRVEWDEVADQDALGATARGVGGFGSSGR